MDYRNCNFFVFVREYKGERRLVDLNVCSWWVENRIGNIFFRDLENNLSLEM